jgi:hypothetical protein
MAGLVLKSGDVRRQRRINAQKGGSAEVATKSTQEPKSKPISLTKRQKKQKAKHQEKGGKCIDEDPKHEYRTDDGSNSRSLHSERDSPEVEIEFVGCKEQSKGKILLHLKPNTGEIECVKADA